MQNQRKIHDKFLVRRDDKESFLQCCYHNKAEMCSSIGIGIGISILLGIGIGIGIDFPKI